MFNEFAPAKLNLYLHITGRRGDGYHNLDSLVAFAGAGDELRLEQAYGFQLRIEGPQAGTLMNAGTEDNLITKAARSYAALVGRSLDVKLTLVKNLPVASGIGGGSSDAAAALRLLARHWLLPSDDPRLAEAAAKHGQDVPVCLRIENNYITDTGMAAAPDLPHADLVLVNPNKGLPTMDVYKAYRDGGHDFTPAARLEKIPGSLEELATALKTRRNDLYEPACFLMPEIKAIIAALEATSSCCLARMSGSGATCFGLYENRDKARKAAADILAAHPDWWVAQSYLPFHPRLD